MQFGMDGAAPFSLYNIALPFRIYLNAHLLAFIIRFYATLDWIGGKAHHHTFCIYINPFAARGLICVSILRPKAITQ